MLTVFQNIPVPEILTSVAFSKYHLFGILQYALITSRLVPLLLNSHLVPSVYLNPGNFKAHEIVSYTISVITLLGHNLATQHQSVNTAGLLSFVFASGIQHLEVNLENKVWSTAGMSRLLGSLNLLPRYISRSWSSLSILGKNINCLSAQALSITGILVAVSS